jgi:hypothetical protein
MCLELATKSKDVGPASRDALIASGMIRWGGPRKEVFGFQF